MLTSTTLATISSFEEESGTRGGGGGKKAMYCSRRRVPTCIACASDRCNAIDTLCRNHVHNKLMKGLDPAHSLDANVAHSTEKSTYLLENAPYVSKAKGTNFIVIVIVIVTSWNRHGLRF